VTTPAPIADGRSARSQRTRAAVVDALLALLREGDPRPTARQIAERANVSLRSVYVHFDDLEDLFLAVAERELAVVQTMIAPVPRDAPLSERVELACAMRAQIFEELAPIGRAAQLQAPTSPTLEKVLKRGRDRSRSTIATVFDPELRQLPPRQRRLRIAAIDAVAGPEAWRVLRDGNGLSVADAQTAMADAVRDLLVPAAAAEAHRR
jgi:TetR/AcrR family transcriptional regulator of autoinduction and epiphytic fitness